MMTLNGAIDYIAESLEKNCYTAGIQQEQEQLLGWLRELREWRSKAPNIMELERPVPKAGDVVRHFKGKLYKVLGVATETETNEQYVVYQALYAPFKEYVRPYDMFCSEVDHEKYPNVTQKWRFEICDA